MSTQQSEAWLARLCKKPSFRLLNWCGRLTNRESRKKRWKPGGAIGATNAAASMARGYIRRGRHILHPLAAVRDWFHGDLMSRSLPQDVIFCLASSRVFQPQHKLPLLDNSRLRAVRALLKEALK
jgi:hypothetical protein